MVSGYSLLFAGTFLPGSRIGISPEAGRLRLTASAGCKASTGRNWVRIAEGKRCTPGRLIWVTDLQGFRLIWTTTRKDLHVTKNLLKYSLVMLGLALSTCTTAFAFMHARKSQRLIPASQSAASRCLREQSRFCAFGARSRRLNHAADDEPPSWLDWGHVSPVNAFFYNSPASSWTTLSIGRNRRG